MDVVSVCSLPVSSVVWQPSLSVWVLTVVCKATFSLRPGEVVLANEQEAPTEEDDYWNDDPSRSLRAPSDLAPMKPKAEVILVGQAFAPGHVPVRSLVARLMVGEVDRSIEVVCDRLIAQDGSVHEGPRFARMPLTYERAAGGPGTWNPVGVRADARDSAGRRPLPNLQAVGTRLSRQGDVIEPAGFGPIAPTWPTRVGKLGSHAPGSRVAELWRSRPLPGDVDLDFFNAAPAGQQLAALRENERLVLENLSPAHPHLVTTLPGLRPAAFVDRGRGVQRLPMRADTLWIDTDRGICTLTWRGQLSLERTDEAGRVAVAMEAPGFEVTWPEVERRLALHAAGAANARASEDEEDETGVVDAVPMDEVDVVDDDEEEGVFPPATDQVSEGKYEITAKVSSFAPAPAPALPFGPGAKEITATGENRSPLSPSAGLPFQTAASKKGSGAWPTVKAPAPPSALPPAPPPPPGAGPDGVTFRAPAPTLLDLTPAPAASSDAVPFRAPAPTLLDMTPVPVAPAGPGGPSAVPFRAPAPPTPAPPAPAPPQGASPAAPGVPEPTGAWGAAVQAPSLATPTTGPAAPVVQGGRVQSPWAAASNTSGTAGATSGLAVAPMPVAPIVPTEAGGAAPASGPTVTPWSMPRRDVRADSSRQVLRLVWYDPQSVPRARRVQRWKPILDELDQKPADRDLDDPELSKDPMEVEDRRDIFEILAHADRTDGKGVEEAFEGAIRDDGKFVPPLVLVAGEVEVPFDELETLKAAVTTATPLVGPMDEGLRATVAVAREFLQTPGLSSAPTVSEGLTMRIREAFVREKKTLPADYLDVQMERALLAGRHYQRRDVLGGTHVRFLLRPPGESQALLGYVPDEVAKKMPLYKRFLVRVVAEVHMPEDQYETASSSLRVLALARVQVGGGSRL